MVRSPTVSVLCCCFPAAMIGAVLIGAVVIGAVVIGAARTSTSMTAYV